MIFIKCNKNKNKNGCYSTIGQKGKENNFGDAPTHLKRNSSIFTMSNAHTIEPKKFAALASPQQSKRRIVATRSRLTEDPLTLKEISQSLMY